MVVRESIFILRGWERVLVVIKDRFKLIVWVVVTLLYLFRDFERFCSILNF